MKYHYVCIRIVKLKKKKDWQCQNIGEDVIQPGPLMLEMENDRTIVYFMSFI